MQRILVIGGSRFAGRVFSLTALSKGYETHVVNRGNYPLSTPGITEYKCDRSSPRRLERILPELRFDAIVDFCAAKENDVAGILTYLGGRAEKYIMISCALDETKQQLEKELWDYRGDTIGTVLRPTRIYGEYNYNAGEGLIVEKIAKRHTVTVPLDATAEFNFIYVRDLANAVCAVVESDAGDNKTYNIAQPIRVTYNRLFSDFERYNGGSFETEGITVDEIIRRNITLPFPLTEAQIIDGSEFTEDFGFEYTQFSVGMESTFKTIYKLFS